MPSRSWRRPFTWNPPQVVDGGVIADGYSADLDELRRLQSDSGQFLVELEARKGAHRHSNLRVAYNSVHGYYIEVTGSHVAKVPDDYTGAAER